MSVCKGYQPEKVLHYFEEICQIPHGSGNLDGISQYLVDFAKKRNLSYTQDEAKNVIIVKEASKGYENYETIMIQGHMDMVCEKNADSKHNFKKDSLDLCIIDDYLFAKGTTLGGDDGIAVAYALAILDDDVCKHPRLEVVITTDEEIGMLGATKLDLSQCKAKKMLNID
jgi:dipeptidase D